MIPLLAQNPLLLLFLVIAAGYAVGRVRVAGFSLGVAAVLFAGLAFGALSPELKLPEAVHLLGLVLFVYTVGLASGPTFFGSLRRSGLPQAGLVVGLLCLAGALAWGAHRALDLGGPLTAGLFAGAFTNTPALAALLQTLEARGGEGAGSLPVIAYSVAYPMGVIGMLLAIYALRRIWHVLPAAPSEPLVNRTVRVEHPEAAPELGERVRLGRVERGGALGVAVPGQALVRGDVVGVIGQERDVQAAAALLGAETQPLNLGREQLDMRRVFVSRAHLAGRRIGDLHLPQRYGALVTRVRRGDVDLLAHEDTVLELGDRVRVVAPSHRLAEVSRVFGDSARRLSEVDMMTFGVGIALGLLLGLVPLPLPGGGTFQLGFAGGPLIAGLVLGALGRSGPLVWPLPYSANLTLRQLGLTLFLAGIGTRSGDAFATTLGGALGITLFLTGALLTGALALLTLWLAHRKLGLSFASACGLLAGLQTQPAVLGFAVEQTRSDEPNVTYATVYPVATIVKIILVQLLALLR